METVEIKNIIKILSTAYLYKKKGTFPNQQEIDLEIKRRERWLSSILKKYSGEKAFLMTLREIYNDPPKDFKD